MDDGGSGDGCDIELYVCKYCAALFTLPALQPHLLQCTAREKLRCERKELIASVYELPRELLDSFDRVAANLLVVNDADLVFAGIYVGSRASAGDEAFLVDKRIGFVLNCAVELALPAALYAKLGIAAHQLVLTDEIDSLIAVHFAKSAAFARQAHDAFERDGTALLVHCNVGQSRSPAIVMAILLILHGLTLRDAWLRVKRARPIAYPQPTFFSALMRLECELFGLDMSSIPEDVLKLHASVLL